MKRTDLASLHVMTFTGDVKLLDTSKGYAGIEAQTGCFPGRPGSYNTPALWLVVRPRSVLLALAAHAQSAHQHRPRDEPGLRRFLVNIAKIELWLLGLPSKIKGQNDYPVAGFKRAMGRMRGGGRFRKTTILRNANLQQSL